MRNLAAWCHDRRRTVIGLWVAAFFVSAALWATVAGEYVNSFNLPGTESQRAYDLLRDKFPAQSGDTASVVFAVKDGGVLDAANQPQIEKVIAEIKKSPEVLNVSDPFAEGAPVSKDGKITFAQIQFAAPAGDVDPAGVKTMAETHARARRPARRPGRARRRHHPLVDRSSRAAPVRSSASSSPRSCSSSRSAWSRWASRCSTPSSR